MNNDLIDRINKRAQQTEMLIDDVLSEDTLLEEHYVAMRACAAEEMIKSCQTMATLLKMTWSVCRQRMFDGDYDDRIDKMYLLASMAIDRVMGALTHAQKVGSFYKNKGYDIVGLDTLANAKREVAEVKDEFDADWPSPNHDRISKSRAQYHSGRYVQSGDLLSNEQNGNSA